MSKHNKTQPNRGLSAKTVACAAFTALLAFASLTGPAAARWGDDDDRRNDQRNEQRNDRDDHRDNRQDWNRDQWREPPVIYTPYYNAPSYYAPPVYYSPGLDLNFNIR